MTRQFITSIKGQVPLKLGYPVLDFHYDALPFLLDSTTPGAIALGTAVMTTAVQGTYKTVKDSGVTVTADNVQKVKGFVLGNNAKIPHNFPAQGPDMVQPGAYAEVVVQGAIAVKFNGSTLPQENDKVYIVTASTATGYAVGDIVDGTTVENVTKVALDGWLFMGIDGIDDGVQLVAINKGF